MTDGADAAGAAGASAGAAGGAAEAVGAAGAGAACGAAAFFAAPFPALGNCSFSLRATGASTVELALLTNSPISPSFASTSLLFTPSSFASSCTRALPATGLLVSKPQRVSATSFFSYETQSSLLLHRVAFIGTPCSLLVHTSSDLPVLLRRAFNEGASWARDDARLLLRRPVRRVRRLPGGLAETLCVVRLDRNSHVPDAGVPRGPADIDVDRQRRRAPKRSDQRQCASNRRHRPAVDNPRRCERSQSTPVGGTTTGAIPHFIVP
ncbi:hypothetical protein CLV47_102255 [Antricoccus suffuscus]|uniref:Uncharacterized protein n=1 Tax=Antricoccus suffuscus TaxID=1629062 RepID=A0A2T1A4Z7_9ACTN|nr:hypothetical protein CLV47_102255 [Antricoccus suffuscus]